MLQNFLIVVGGLSFGCLGILVHDNKKEWGERVAEVLGSIMVIAGGIVAMGALIVIFNGAVPA